MERLGQGIQGLFFGNSCKDLEQLLTVLLGGRLGRIQDNIDHPRGTRAPASPPGVTCTAGAGAVDIVGEERCLPLMTP